MRCRTIPLSLFFGMLAACQSPSGTSPHVGETATARAAMHVIRGRATFPQRIKIAPGASFHVQLIDSQLADTPRAVLAETTLANVAGPPYAFELPYDASKRRPQGLYGLHASLRSASGELLFVTDTRVAVAPGRDDVGEFPMIMVNGAASPAVPSAQADDVRAHASPWDEARAGGVAFRAAGNEPGWWVEVDAGDSPALRATLDYGERKLEVAHAVGISSTPGFAGKTADGTDVVLRIHREACSDDMSGASYEAHVELQVADRTYRGCGAWLDE